MTNSFSYGVFKKFRENLKEEFMQKNCLWRYIYVYLIQKTNQTR
jgi:hypothetical protein